LIVRIDEESQVPRDDQAKPVKLLGFQVVAGHTRMVARIGAMGNASLAGLVHRSTDRS
jgi:hypothetical protein